MGRDSATCNRAKNNCSQRQRFAFLRPESLGDRIVCHHEPIERLPVPLIPGNILPSECPYCESST
jgi:hypothetical protein